MRELNRARDDQNRRRVLVPYLLLLTGLCFTTIVYYYFSKLTYEQDQSRFQKSVQELQDRMRLKVETSIALLHASTGLFAASNNVEPREFDRFVQQLDLQKNYPGIQGIGFALTFPPDQKEALVKRMRAQGVPTFHVWPDERRDEYSAIIYLQPNENDNDKAIGYDMFSEPVRREAMEKARDSGAPTASGRVRLVQETAQQWGFLIYSPVYRNGASTNSIPERRNALVGYVYSPYRIDNFIEPITSAKNYDVSFQIYDGTEINDSAFLHGARDDPPPSDRHFTHTDKLLVAGRTWTVNYAIKPSFERGSGRPLLKYTIITGVLLSFLFFAVTRAEVRARSRAEKSAEEVRQSEAAINEANQRALFEYERLLERISTLSQVLGTARELNTIFRGLREFTNVSVPCDGFFVSLYDPIRDVRTACYAWGDGNEVDVSALPPMPVTERGPNSRAVRTGEVVITNDYMHATRGHASVIVGGPDNGLRPESSVAVPMAVMGRIIGTIEVQSYKPNAYQQEHVAAMSMAANLTAVAIENVRLLKLERAAREAAEESNRLKDEFLATVSHELRTPLTAILGWARLLEDGALDPAVTQQAIDTIWRNAKAQAQIVDDILDVSRIITGNLYIDLHPIEVAPVVQNAINVVRPTADAKGIRIEAQIDNTPAMVSGDANRLQQVIWNLLSNAVKFTNNGGRVLVSVSQANAAVEISVADSGQGIRREFLPYVFDRFSQADSTTTRHHGGLGLGLAIARHLVEIHGGTIRAESRGEGEGARFTITLPLTDASARKGGGAPGTEKTFARPAPQLLSGLNVLLVDDDSDTLSLMATALTRRQANVTAVSSAGEAIQAIREKRPDVLVSDIAMPDEDGYGLIEKVRSLENGTVSSIPAVAITAYAKEEDRDRALSAGFQIYLAKPVELTELVSVVARAARRDF